jgi:hypothetical protein
MRDSDFDKLLDEVLKEGARVEPRVGMELRVMAGVRAEAARKQRLLRWWVPVGVCAGLALAAVLVMQSLRATHDSVASDLKVNARSSSAEIATGVASVNTDEHVKETSVPKVVRREAHRTPVFRAEVATEHPQKMETFPAVAQTGGFLPERGEDSGAKVLREVVASPQVAQALVELKAQQDQPVQVSAIEIEPL